MRAAIAIVLLFFAYHTHGKEDPAASSQDTLDRSVDKLIDRAPTVDSSIYADMDSTMLAKPGGLSATYASPSQTLSSRPVGTMSMGPRMGTMPRMPLQPRPWSTIEPPRPVQMKSKRFPTTLEVLREEAPELATVKKGYLRYLWARPDALAKVKNKQLAAQQETKRIENMEVEKKKSEALVERMASLKLKKSVKVNEEGALFDSIGKDDIVTMLQNQAMITIKEKNVILEDPIKTLGDFEVKLNLPGDVPAQVKVKIEDEAVVGKDKGDVWVSLPPRPK